MGKLKYCGVEGLNIWMEWWNEG